MRFLLPLLVAFLVLGAAACDLAPRSTTDATREQWEAMAPRNKERLSGLRNRQTITGGRVAALVVPSGVQDPALSSLIAELNAKVQELEASITQFQQTLGAVSDEIEGALNRRDKVAARRLVDQAGPRLDQAYAMAGAPFDAIDQRLPEAEAATSRHLAQVAAEEQRMMRAASAGGDIDVALKWNGNEVDFADGATKATFDRIVRVGSACDQLRMTVVANSAARADALTGKLIGAGVPADHVKAGNADKQLPADQVKVTVTAPCLPTAGAGNPAAEVAPGSARPAAQPGMPPPPTAVVGGAHAGHAH